MSDISIAIILNLLFLLISFFGVFLFGHFVVSLFKQTESENYLFLKLTIGFIFVPTFYALLMSGGTTVLILNVFLGIGLILYHRDMIVRSSGQFVSNLKTIDSGLWQSTVFVVIAYLYLLRSFFDIAAGNFRFIASDYSFYARVAGYLRDIGMENRYVDYFLPALRSTTPYHYLDLWFGALVSQVFDTHVQYALVLIVYPILLASIYVGALKIVRLVKKNCKKPESVHDYFLAGAIFIVGMFGFLYPSSIAILKTDLWVSSVNGFPKLLVIYVFLIWIFILLSENRREIIGIVVCLLAVAYITVAPGIFLAATSFYIYRFLFRKERLGKTALSLSPLVFTALFFIIFQTGGDGGASVVHDREELISYYTSYLALKTGVNVVGKLSIQIILTTIPYLFCLYISRNYIFKKQKDATFFLILLGISSVVSYLIVHQMHDSVQLWSNVFMPLVNIGAFVICVAAIYAQPRLSAAKYYLILILLLNVFDHFSGRRTHILAPNSKSVKLETKRIKELFGAKSPRFGYFRKSNEYTDYFSKFEQVYIGHTSTLIRVFDPLVITCLSIDNIPIVNPNEERFNNNTTFRKYTETQKQKGNFVSISQSQLSFVIEFDLNFLLVSQKGKLPVHMAALFEVEPIGSVDGYNIFRRTEV